MTDTDDDHATTRPTVRGASEAGRLAELERRLQYRTRALHLLQDIALLAGEHGSWDRAVRHAMVRLCEFDGWTVGRLFRVGGDGRPHPTGVRHVIAGGVKLARLLAGDPERASAAVERAIGERRADWTSVPEDDRRAPLARAAVAIPVVAGERVVAVLEFLSPRPLPDSDELLVALDNIGVQLGQVWRRQELERHLADTAMREQRRIGRELHDSLGQQLTGIGMMTRSLLRALEDAPPAARERAAELLETVQGAQAQLRSLIKGVMPVEVDAGGLMTSLEELVDEYQRLFEVDCRFRCEHRVLVEDNATATHLHRIAREALHNAVKHAGAGRVELALDESHGTVRLTVEDDGSGFELAAAQPADGLGLHIMRYRARLIGAELEIADRPGGGTRVTCTFDRGQWRSSEDRRAAQHAVEEVEPA